VIAPLLSIQVDDIVKLIRTVFPLGAQTKSEIANEVGGLGNNANRLLDDHSSIHDDTLVASASSSTTDIKQPTTSSLSAVSPSSESVVPSASSQPFTSSLRAASPVSQLVPLLPIPSSLVTIPTSIPTAPTTAATTVVVQRSIPVRPMPHLPRVLVHGLAGMGQSHVGPALLHAFEEYPVYSLDLPSLLGDSTYAYSFHLVFHTNANRCVGSARNAEETCVRCFVESQRNAPSIIYWPHVVSSICSLVLFWL
jgi:hypothetical protein